MAVFINRVLKVSNKNIAYFEYSFCKVAYVDSLSVRIFYINYFWILEMSHKLSIIICERLLCVFSHLLRVSSILFFFFFFFNEVKGILRLKKIVKIGACCWKQNYYQYFILLLLLPSSKMWLQKRKHQRQGKRNAFKNFNTWTLVTSSLGILLQRQYS